MTRTIIMLSGKAGSGKDYTANWLVQNKGFTRFAFADHLKDLVSYRYNIKRSMFDTQEGKKLQIVAEGEKFSLRDLLISTANLERYKNNLVFVNKVKTAIEASPFDKIVISDFRYPEEYSVLKEYFCNYQRNGSVITVRIQGQSSIQVNDSSETQLDSFPFDKVIHNCQTPKFDSTLSHVFREYE